MRTDFVLFGPGHVAIIATIAALGALLAWLVREAEVRARRLRLALGLFLLVNELAWYAYKYSTEGNRFPEGLPLQLCDLSLWLTVISLLAVRQWTFDIAWFVGIGGAAMAVLTPELWAPAWSYPTIYFFVAHGGIISALLFLLWSGQSRPAPGAMWRALAVLNGWGLVVGTFNAVFHTNYLYLCHKPSSASALDGMGPWPWYVVSGEVAAVAVFALLALPFRRRG